jgi:hypothetical protein
MDKYWVIILGLPHNFPLIFSPESVFLVWLSIVMDPSLERPTSSIGSVVGLDIAQKPMASQS